MRATKVTLRFNLNKEADRHAYEFLRGADSSYSKTAIAALNAYLDGQTQQAREEAFLQRVLDAIRQELRATNPVAGLLQLLQPVQPEKPKPSEEDEENMLAFLDAFDGAD